MALEKLKQVFEDANLKDAPKAEHGTPKFAHVNVLVDYINALEAQTNALQAQVNALEAQVDAGLPSFADNAAATNGGLTVGQSFFDTTNGVVAEVTA